ncbi:MAG: SAM-dependent methyltransferase [Burkholderiaceae bacterium]|nr:SAM-dependent methyltransferase [Burkholderiaceae bacterium]
MSASGMRIAMPEPRRVADESEIIDEVLSLKGAAVLELGCGPARMTRIVAPRAASVVALDVDERQHEKNLQIKDLPNVVFGLGGAESIPVRDAEFDVVFMFKSLHHVEIDRMDDAFAEIHRVLKDGGCAYISEPVFDGDFNEILRIFNNEEIVREAAFEAERRAIMSRQFSLLTQVFFWQSVHFDCFGQFEEQSIKVTYSERRLSQQQYDEVLSRFNRNLTQSGADFLMPIRVDVLQKQRG